MEHWNTEAFNYASGSLILSSVYVANIWIPACKKHETDVLSLKCESLLLLQQSFVTLTYYMLVLVFSSFPFL